MKENEVHDKLIAQTESIDLVATELRWMLETSEKQNVQPETPLAEEMMQKFFSLYKDFKQIKESTFKLREDVRAVHFTDRTIGLIYNATADLLCRKINQGIFEQFQSVAEHWCLPDGTTFDDLSS